MAYITVTDFEAQSYGAIPAGGTPPADLQATLDTAANLIDEEVGYSLQYHVKADEAHPLDTDSITFPLIESPARAVLSLEILATWGTLLGQRTQWQVQTWPPESANPNSGYVVNFPNQNPIVFGTVTLDRANGIVQAVLPMPTALLPLEPWMQYGGTSFTTYSVGYDPLPPAPFNLPAITGSAVPQTITMPAGITVQECPPGALLLVDTGVMQEYVTVIATTTSGGYVTTINGVFLNSHPANTAMTIVAPDGITLPVPAWLKEINRVAAADLIFRKNLAAQVPMGVSSYRVGQVAYGLSADPQTGVLSDRVKAMIEKHFEAYEVA